MRGGVPFQVSCFCFTFIFYSATAGCEYYDQLTPRVSKPTWDLGNCTWYRGDACCENTEVNAVFEHVPGIEGGSPRCLEVYNYLMCYFCHPIQSEFYSETDGVSVCGWVCDEVMRHCRDAYIKGQKIGDLYAGSGRAFCEKNSFVVGGSSRCYGYDGRVYGVNASPTTAPPMSLLVLAAVLCTAAQQLFGTECDEYGEDDSGPTTRTPVPLSQENLQEQVAPRRHHDTSSLHQLLTSTTTTVALSSFSSVAPRPLFVLLLLLLVCITPSVEAAGEGDVSGDDHCPYFASRAPVPTWSLRNCTWFSDNSCCRAEEADVLAGLMSPFMLQVSDPRCHQAMNYLMCHPCSPDQRLFYEEERVSVCGSLCDTAYQLCADSGALYYGEPFASRFLGGDDFCQQHRFVVDRSPSSLTCYGMKDHHYLADHWKLLPHRNAASAVRPGLLTSLALAIGATLALLLHTDRRQSPPVLLLLLLLLACMTSLPVASATTPPRVNNSDGDGASTTPIISGPLHTTTDPGRPLLVASAGVGRLNGNGQGEGGARGGVRGGGVEEEAVAAGADVSGLGPFGVDIGMRSRRLETDTISSESVVQWAGDISQRLLDLTANVAQAPALQAAFDTATYVEETVDATARVQAAADKMALFFGTKDGEVETQALRASELYHGYFYQEGPEAGSFQRVEDVPLTAVELYDKQRVDRMPATSFSPDFAQNVSYEASSIKIADQVRALKSYSEGNVRWTARMDSSWVSAAEGDSSVRWTYLGTPDGLYRGMPSSAGFVNQGGHWKPFDVRIRPWFVAATSGPKDVVIVIDASDSMRDDGKLDRAKAVAKEVLSSLSSIDFVNVIAYRSSAWHYWPYFVNAPTETLGCVPGNLLPATPSVKKDLKEKIGEIRAYGGSQPREAVGIAADLLENSPVKTGCQQLVIFITDGLQDDANARRDHGSYDSEGNYVPAKTVFVDFEPTLADARAVFADRGVRFFAYNVQRTNQGNNYFPGHLGCGTDGSSTRVVDTLDLSQSMSKYFDFLQRNTRSTENVWTVPYVDAAGLGLVITLTRAVYDTHTNGVAAVVALDVTLNSIEAELRAHVWGDAYAFMVNEVGETVVHPRLMPATLHVDDPTFPDINFLEQWEGEPAEFTTLVRDPMLQGESGNVLLNTRRAVFAGDREDGVAVVDVTARYVFAPVEGTKFSLCFVLNEPSDVIYRRTSLPVVNATTIGGDNFYHLAASDMSRPGKLSPGVLALADAAAQLNLELTEPTDPLRPSMLLSWEHSTVQLAMRSFCDPNADLRTDYYNGRAPDIQSVVSGNEDGTGPSEVVSGCDTGGLLLPSVVADVALSRKIEDAWLGSGSDTLTNLADQVIRVFVATKNGVLRLFPGHRVDKVTDGPTQSWFYRAAAWPDLAVVSPPYEAEFGLGKVVTLTRAVLEGKPLEPFDGVSVDCVSEPYGAACACTTSSQCLSKQCYDNSCGTPRVAAAAGLDMPYTTLHDAVATASTSAPDATTGRKCGDVYQCPDGYPTSDRFGNVCRSECMLVDRNGNLVVHDDFLEADPSDKSLYERVHLAEKFGRLVATLHGQGVYDRHSRVEFQGTCDKTPLWEFRSTRPEVEYELSAEELEARAQTHTFFPPWENAFGCAQQVVHFELGEGWEDDVITGHEIGACGEYDYVMAPVEGTNLHLIVLDNWVGVRASDADSIFVIQCHIDNNVLEPGGHRTYSACSVPDDQLNVPRTCPATLDVVPDCDVWDSNSGLRSSSVVGASNVVVVVLVTVLAMVRLVVVSDGGGL